MTYISDIGDWGAPIQHNGLDLTLHCAGSGGRPAGTWLTALGGESCPMHKYMERSVPYSSAGYADARWSDHILVGIF